MIDVPFGLFRQFDDRLRVAFFAKADDVRDDKDVASALGANRAAGLWQIHGNRTVVIREPCNRTEQADGMITDVPDLALCLRVADCQSFIVFEPRRNAIGVLHAGWRGLVTDAIPEFFRTMKREWGIVPPETFVGAGPSLCARCADFSDPALELPSLPKEFIHGKTADLQGAATAQLLDLGVRPDRIERHADCTRCRPDLYWTYRGGDRDAVKNGHANMLVCVIRKWRLPTALKVTISP